jgi:translocation and assembly module TamB
MEAGQLGLAVAQLTTGGGGAGILDRIRGLVGVDVLSVGSTDAGDPSVTAGKYIGGDVFVGVEQGASTESSSAKVEVDLSDNIAVESRVGATGSSEVGIQFKWDY